MPTVKTLLADDHALIRAGLRDALATLPELEIVGEVGNGPDLMDALGRLRVDLLVVDVNMPDFEPVSAITRIRNERPGLQILVVSAYDDQAYVVGLLSVGVNGYHLKDQPLSDLLLAVRRILDGGRWISDPLVNRLVSQQPATPTLDLNLTRRQRELLYLLTQGYNNQKIAHLMDISVKTVENHLTALYRAIGVESRLEANNFGNRHPELLVKPVQEHSPERTDTTGGDLMTVLLVDDNPRYRAQLSKLLGKTCRAAMIYEAEDCAEAVKIATQMKPRLAFIDVVLREEDGIQCVRMIKAVSSATRMVLISAYPDREFRRIGLSAGAIAFLDKKDIDATTMRHVVEDALESEKQAR